MLMLADEKAHLFFLLDSVFFSFFLLYFVLCDIAKICYKLFLFFCYEKGAPFNLN